MIQNHDRHLFLLMQSFLEKFNEKKIELPAHIDNLDSLYRETSSTTASWQQIFHKNWGNLESIYAGSLYENRTILTDYENKVLQLSVETLQMLVDKELAEYSKFVDPTVSKEATVIDEKWLMCPDCIDAWESSSKDPMIVCPKCNQAFHNPRNKQE